MKIAISATDKHKESLLDRRFGRCDYFQIFDTEIGDYKVICNIGATSGGGAGIAAASQVIEENVSVVITGNLGPNAFELIEKAAIKACSCEALPIIEVVDMYLKNQLSEISMAGNAHHGLK